MKMRDVLRAAFAATLLLTSACTRTERADTERPPAAAEQREPAPAPSAGVSSPEPSAESQKSASQTQAGGDTRPSPVDPAQGTKTGANVGEGASYSRSTEQKR
jgi:hypothetical protein